MGCVIHAAEETIAGRYIRLLPFNDRAQYTARPVTFVLILRFEHVSASIHRFTGCSGDRLLLSGPRAGRTELISVPVFTAAHHAVFEVRTHAVDLTVGREHMEDIIADARCAAAPP